MKAPSLIILDNHDAYTTMVQSVRTAILANPNCETTNLRSMCCLMTMIDAMADWDRAVVVLGKAVFLLVLRLPSLTIPLLGRVRRLSWCLLARYGSSNLVDSRGLVGMRE